MKKCSGPAVRVDSPLVFQGVLVSEWIKLWSVRSTKWAALVALPAMVLSAVLTASASGTASGPTGGLPHSFVLAMNLGALTSGIGAAVLFVGVVAAVGGASEFSTGLARVTLAVVPHRWMMVLAKFVSAGLFALMVGSVGVALSGFAAAWVFEMRGYPVDLLHPSVILPALSAVVILPLVAAIASAIGVIARSSAVGVSFVLAAMLLLPMLLSITSTATQDASLANLAALLPSTLAASALYRHPGFLVDPDTQHAFGAWVLQPWQGATVLAVWAGAVGAIALYEVRRRDP